MEVLFPLYFVSILVVLKLSGVSDPVIHEQGTGDGREGRRVQKSVGDVWVSRDQSTEEEARKSGTAKLRTNPSPEPYRPFEPLQVACRNSTHQCLVGYAPNDPASTAIMTQLQEEQRVQDFFVQGFPTEDDLIEFYKNHSTWMWGGTLLRFLRSFLYSIYLGPLVI
jgi:hypothetical protein